MIMDKLNLIKPVIYLKPNQCPECRSNLILVEESRSVANLDENGFPNPMDILEEEYESKLVCTECGKEFPVDKRGPYFCISRTTPKIAKNIIAAFNPFYA